MSGDVHVQFCESLWGKFPLATLLLCIVPLRYENKIEKIVEDKIESINLEINLGKTEKRRFEMINGQLTTSKPLQYLGFTFDGKNKIIRSAAFSRFSERMKGGVLLAKCTKNKYNEIRLQNGGTPEKLYKRKLYERYSHLGKQNFIRYGFRCAKIMKSNAIKKQLKPLWNRLQNEINIKNNNYIVDDT